MSYKALSAFARKNEAAVADVRFTDLWGTWHHISIPMSRVRDALCDGIGYDGSSIRGYQPIEASDMVLRIDTQAPYFMDPFTEHRTLVLFADSYNPGNEGEYGKDPRTVAKRTERFLTQSGIADTAFFGPEAEFFIFDNVEFVMNDGKPCLKAYSEEFESEGQNHGH